MLLILEQELTLGNKMAIIDNNKFIINAKSREIYAAQKQKEIGTKGGKKFNSWTILVLSGRII